MKRSEETNGRDVNYNYLDVNCNYIDVNYNYLRLIELGEIHVTWQYF